MMIALAHIGQALAPHDILTEWAPDPLTFVALACLSILYANGVRRLWLHAGEERVITRARASAGGAGIAALVIALLSPLDAAASALLTIHMVQHLLLVLVAAPLVVIGRMHLALFWSLPFETRRGLGAAWANSPRFKWFARFMTAPATAWVLHTVAIWLWHSRSLYDLAANNETWHAVEHVSFFATAVLFSLPVEKLWRSSHGMAEGAAMLYVFASAMQSGALGALLALSGSTWYRSHAASAPAWGLSPLEDQQLAGVLMWGPASVVYLLVLLMLVKLWIARGAGTARRTVSAATSEA
jgi:putative membrane protein